MDNIEILKKNEELYGVDIGKKLIFLQKKRLKRQKIYENLMISLQEK